MISEIEAGASKTKQAFHDATETVADTAKTQSGRFEKIVRLGLRTLPLLPERTFEMMLDRMGLMRKSSGLGGVALFIGGFAAGSAVTAFSTPYTGSQLRTKIFKLVGGLADSAEAKAEEVASDVVAAEKKAVKGAKSIAADAKDAVTGAANDAKDAIKGATTEAKDGVSKSADGVSAKDEKDTRSEARHGNTQRTS
ncbi:hypothetical protein BH09MYX1_BH09MYX1_59650 [soil metagenome]